MVPEGAADPIKEDIAKLKRVPNVIAIEPDTRMAVESLLDCIEDHKNGRAFSWEHPGGSMALRLAEAVRLMGMPGVIVVEFHACMFEGGRRRKWTILITNIEELAALRLTCTGKERCSRTGLPHAPWEEKSDDGAISFLHNEEAEYSWGFCKAYADQYILSGAFRRFRLAPASAVGVVRAHNSACSHASARL